MDRNLDRVLEPAPGPEPRSPEREVAAEPEEREALEEANPPRDDDQAELQRRHAADPEQA